jgi:hypothetical protein
MADVPSIKIPLHACAPYAYVTLSSTKPEFMIRQPSHFEANPLTVRYTSSFRSHLSDVRKYVVRRRLWLLGLGSLCCMITIAGIVYSCHVNYVADGGVGWIKYSRSVAIPGKEKFAETFLPVRKFEKFHDNSVSKRDHPGVIPYYECGDQLQSCVAFNQPVCNHQGTNEEFTDTLTGYLLSHNHVVLCSFIHALGNPVLQRHKPKVLRLFLTKPSELRIGDNAVLS